MTEKNELEAGNPRIMKEKLGEGLGWSDVVFQCVLDNNSDSGGMQTKSAELFWFVSPHTKVFLHFSFFLQT